MKSIYVETNLMYVVFEKFHSAYLRFSYLSWGKIKFMMSLFAAKE
jgi:hypothetical protein